MELSLASAVLLLIVSCGTVQTPGAKLKFSVMDYNQAYRWGKYYAASKHLLPKHRKAFLAETIDSNVKITEFDIQEVSHDTNKKQATVIVKIRWYAPPSITVKKSVYKQQWKWIGHIWLLTKQSLLKTKKTKKHRG